MLLRKQPNVVVQDYYAVADILRSNDYVAVLPEYLALEVGPRVVRVFSDSKPTTSGMDLAIPRNRTTKRCERVFIDFFRNEARA
jgi:DNA-binding transcriptional LysR family regulator